VGWVVRSWAKRPRRGTGCGGDAVVAVALTLREKGLAGGVSMLVMAIKSGRSAISFPSSIHAPPILGLLRTTVSPLLEPAFQGLYIIDKTIFSDGGFPNILACGVRLWFSRHILPINIRPSIRWGYL